MRKPKLQFDNRVHPRVRCNLDLDLNVFGICSYDWEAVDLSLVGVGIEYRTTVNTFLYVQGTSVDIALPGFASLKAKVRWVRGKKIGLQFVAPVDKVIESWVGEILTAQGVLFKEVFWGAS